MPQVVGLGASAGGLAAIEQFLAAVPDGSGFAYVVIQHLDPNHKAMLCQLLQRVTRMPVREAAHAMRLEPDSVYVIPPNSELTVERDGLTVFHDVIRLREPRLPRGFRMPIDTLFHSLAQTHANHAIGVVLSGMGSDGTAGLVSIKRGGGLTLAQSPDSAQFDAMPSSAIAAGCVDVIGPPQELPEHIRRVTARVPQGTTARKGDPEQSLEIILTLLRERSKRDLSMYKKSTLLRRIERRMTVHGIAGLREYEGFLRDNPAELDLMFREMLIGVTAFFRDPPVWQELRERVLPRLLREGGDSPLRAWVAGCSTGEEAYSLAMIFHEVAAEHPGPGPATMQVLASDLSADAIEFARKGRYPKTIAADVGEGRLARFFSVENGAYLIKKHVRETVLFAQHDVILDPPFTRVDMVSCRNLLIYFNAALQRRLIPLFHYCLKPGGTLVLGKSETIGATQSLFVPLDSKSRIYTSDGINLQARSLNFPVSPRSSSRNNSQESALSKSPPQPASVQSSVDQIILQQFSPAAVLVNDRGDIVYITGRTGRYLEPASGKADWNIHVMARPGIRAQLADALRNLGQGGSTTELRGLKVEDGSAPPVDVTVHAMPEAGGLKDMVLIIFRDLVVPAAVGRRRRSGGAADPLLEEELQRSRDEIRALRHETRVSKEELQATNEELQSTNEELQSANEELTTSKEEAQSMNEELQTLNHELRTRLDDLALAQSDMQNLLNSTHIATLFLDNELNVRRFTEQATRIVHLREVDIGRPLSELSSTLDYPDLETDAKETLRTLAAAEKEVATTGEEWFLVRIMPYRTAANVIQGVVITFVNITAAKKLESRLRNA